MSLPTKFADLERSELYRSAVEDFAVDVKKDDNEKVILAALLESGIAWADYVAQHPEVKPEEPAVQVVETTRQPEPSRKGGVIGAGEMVGAVVEEVASPQVRVYERPVYNPQDKLLLKMERENPSFQIRGYTFTDKNPYNLVSPEDAEFILNEPGFRQARPSELAEFYG